MNPITTQSAMVASLPANAVAAPEMTRPGDLFAQLLKGSAPSVRGGALGEAPHLAAPTEEEIAKEAAADILLPAIFASLPQLLQSPPIASQTRAKPPEEAQALRATMAFSLPQTSFQAQEAPLLPTSTTSIVAQLANTADSADHKPHDETGQGSHLLQAAPVDGDSLTAPTLFTLPQSAPVEAAFAPAPLDFEAPQLDLARDTQWLDELAQDIVAAAKSEDRLSFRLLPRELGQMDVNLSTSERGLNVKMSTSTEDARAIVAAHQPRLIEELRGQGIRVSEAQVSTGDQRQPERNLHGMMPFIETATDETPVADKQISTRPQGRFA